MNQSDKAKQRLANVYAFIRDFTLMGMPPISNIDQYDWTQPIAELKRHAGFEIFEKSENQDFDGIILKVKKLTETSCPKPPKSISDWIESGWEGMAIDLNHTHARNIDNRGMTLTELFTDSVVRVQDFSQWREMRNEWLAAERPVREANAVFSHFYKLHAQLQRESEKYQLFIADGILVWNSAEGTVNHPVILKKVELEFDPHVPEFIVRESDEDPEFNTTLLRHHSVDGKSISDCKTKFVDTCVDILKSSDAIQFFKYFISRSFDGGQYVDSKDRIEPSRPFIYRDPFLILGPRARGLTEAIDKMIQNLPESIVTSEALLRVVGVDTVRGEQESAASTSNSATSMTEKEVDFLLTKPANRQQEKIIEQLERYGSVLVQGPPGTGKSHTIANIVGHLLASGKSVLVSSHTSKALKVVREKLPDVLKPLCVSVLENDSVNKNELNQSINGIIAYLNSSTKDSLDSEIEQIRSHRNKLKERIAKFQQDVYRIRANEYSDIVVNGEGVNPSDAAKKVADLWEEHGWIPGPIKNNSILSLSESEIATLYSLNASISKEEEAVLSEGLPDLGDVLDAESFRKLSEETNKIDKKSAEHFSDLWNNETQERLGLSKSVIKIREALAIFSAHSWLVELVQSTEGNREADAVWWGLVNLIEKTVADIASRSELILSHGPLSEIEANENNIRICDEIIKHLSGGGTLGIIGLLLRPSWKSFIKASRVDSGAPNKQVHFEALKAALETSKIRRELLLRWNRQIGPIGGPSLIEKSPEQSAKLLTEILKFSLNWKAIVWTSIEAELTSQGFNWNKGFKEFQLKSKEVSFVGKVQEFSTEVLLPALNSRIIWKSLFDLDANRSQMLKVIEFSSKKIANRNFFLNEFKVGIENIDSNLYQSGYNKYLVLRSKTELFVKRAQLIEALSKTAPSWAKAIELRSGIHGYPFAPNNISMAWKIALWNQELELRMSEDYGLAQAQLQKSKIELADVNAKLVEKLAWSYQHARTKLPQQQALSGYSQVRSRITKTGRGVRDAQLIRESRGLLKKCEGAVPVWIMPLARVLESFDLGQEKFDVLILDEASQSDIQALLAFSIAKQVIVVGDDKQVTPQAVGQKLSEVQFLIDQYLKDIPNSASYDGKMSIYHLAQQSFGQRIRLDEHFRCVPDIIEFSNNLSYDGEIKPLREAASSPFKQHLIAHRVAATPTDSDTNREEATEIASLIVAMSEFDEYAESSVGVVSMVGHNQHLLIDSILQKRLDASTYSEMNLLCGTASQFQGDERDVMLISMVDTCDNPPLSIRQTEDFQRKFNVAASRARNQLWVVHSLNPSTDLKPGDLRLRLIHHAMNPRALSTAIKNNQAKADPKSGIFEQSVIKQLMLLGYRVTPQWEVGAYTIDIIVEGLQKRIALECDGDRYHPAEALAGDIQRQLVLERLGWKFIRVRGSEYFRNPQKAIARIASELESYGIERLGSVVTEAKNDDELRQRLIARAYEIREEWLASPELNVEAKPKRSRFGKRASKTEVVSETNGSSALKIELQQEVPVVQPKSLYKAIVSAVEVASPVLAPQSHIPVVPIERVFAIADAVAILKAKGFEIVDHRDLNGRLWIINRPDLKETIKYFELKKLRLFFSPTGSKSTGGRAAYYF